MNKEPLFHIVKRDAPPVWKSILIRIVAIVLALAVSSIVIIALTGVNPLKAYHYMFTGALGTTRRAWVYVRDTMTLLLVSLALVPAFKMRFWNIGAEGQILVGGAATAAVMLYCGNQLPTWLLMIIMVVVSMLAGLIWGVIPALCKTRWNTNETLFTLMLNYVALQVVNVCISYWENPVGSNKVGIINSTTKAGWLPELFGQRYGWNVVIVLVITIGIFIYMKYTKHGYEVAVVGESENTAKYAGINVKKVTIRTMAISGAIAGLTGFLCVSGSDHTLTNTTAGGRGFTAIIVAWVAHLNPFFMLIMSFFLVFLEKGASEIASKMRISDNLSDIVTSILLFFLIGCEFFLNYRVQFRKKVQKTVNEEGGNK